MSREEQSFETLIEPDELAQLMEAGRPIVVDCRYHLADRDLGRRQYVEGHIPTAVYAHLDEDLSGPPRTDAGRHPLPDPGTLSKTFGRLGIGADNQVVAYDDGSGVAASRMWWLLKFVGHDRVAVLNGGVSAWLAAGGTLRSGIETNDQASFRATPDWEKVVLLSAVPSAALLVDSRAPERFRGEMEPIDPVAGHIPGAKNLYHADNYDAESRFLPPAVLSQRLNALLGDVSPKDAVFYCGSGVTACTNLLAMSYAGLGMGKLYAGSWSEWCSEPSNPVACGDS